MSSHHAFGTWTSEECHNIRATFWNKQKQTWSGSRIFRSHCWESHLCERQRKCLKWWAVTGIECGTSSSPIGGSVHACNMSQRLWLKKTESNWLFGNINNHIGKQINCSMKSCILCLHFSKTHQYNMIQHKTHFTRIWIDLSMIQNVGV